MHDEAKWNNRNFRKKRRDDSSFELGYNSVVFSEVRAVTCRPFVKYDIPQRLEDQNTIYHNG